MRDYSLNIPGGVGLNSPEQGYPKIKKIKQYHGPFNLVHWTIISDQGFSLIYAVHSAAK